MERNPEPEFFHEDTFLAPRRIIELFLQGVTKDQEAVRMGSSLPVEVSNHPLAVGMGASIPIEVQPGECICR